MAHVKFVVCRKAKYRSLEDANLDLQKIADRTKNQKNPVIPKYAYKCSSCGSFHLTKRLPIEEIMKENEVLKDRVNSLMKLLEEKQSADSAVEETELQRAVAIIKRSNKALIKEIRKEEYIATMLEQANLVRKQNKQLKKDKNDIIAQLHQANIRSYNLDKLVSKLNVLLKRQIRFTRKLGLNSQTTPFIP